MILPIATAIIAFTLLPFLLLRGRALRFYLGLDLVSYLLALVAWRFVDGIEPRLAVVALGAGKLALLSLLLATRREEELRWSANRAGLAALLVYLSVIPAMVRAPIDGDEPFYLLIAESIARDGDLDLRNQYANLAQSETGRLDLRPQLGDPVGPAGEQYSRHEPFLPLLLVPGYAVAGLYGAVVILALFGALLVRSTVRMLEEEGIGGARARAVFPFLAFGPPILFYATRIWPEVPGGFFFVEALRGVRQRRAQRWLPAILGLVLLKLRFVLLVVPLVAVLLTRSRRLALLLIPIVLLPLGVVYVITGNPLNVHQWRELLPAGPGAYARGLFGLLLDGAAGILFQAPFYFCAILALVRWREMPAAFRLGILSASLYLLYLIPRAEWHGGWAPPLRYIVFLMPVLALGVAAVWDRLPAPLVALIALWTAAMAVHGVAFAWRLFQVANGENRIGEYFSALYSSDFSRLFPSFIRLNAAAFVSAGLLLLLMAVLFAFKRIAFSSALIVPLVSALIATGFLAGRRPAARVDFEDAHLLSRGGEVYPHQYTVARFLYRGGRILRAGEWLSFLARRGRYALHYSASHRALVELEGRAYQLQGTGGAYRIQEVEVPRTGRVQLRCLEGAVNLDRMVRQP